MNSRSELGPAGRAACHDVSITDTARAAAVHTAARHAQDADDLRLVLDALGLDPRITQETRET